MKKIKWNELDSFEQELIDKFLIERKEYDSFNTAKDIDFVIKNDILSVYYNDYGDWIYIESYYIVD